MFREPQPTVTAPPVMASIPRTKPIPTLRVPGCRGRILTWLVYRHGSAGSGRRRRSISRARR